MLVKSVYDLVRSDMCLDRMDRRIHRDHHDPEVHDLQEDPKCTGQDQSLQEEI